MFNKGALFNVGYFAAKKAGCDYIALHDVDQLPLSPNNRYSWPAAQPVHLCSASEQFGFQMVRVYASATCNFDALALILLLLTLLLVSVLSCCRLTARWLAARCC